MVRIQKKRAARWALGLGLAVAAGAASADTMTWNLAGGCAPGPCSASPSGPGLTSVTAWSWRPTDSTWRPATLGEYLPNNGIGVSHPGEPGNPQHAVDNSDANTSGGGPRFDAVLLEFASAVKLSGVTIGWRDTDSDITVLALDGTDSSIDGKTYAQLNTNGWDIVGHYGGQTGSSNSDFDIAVNTAGTFASRFWLVGAYNPNFIGPVGETTGSVGLGKRDHVKILAFAGMKRNGEAPEPSSLLLLLAAGATGFWWRRGKAA